MSQESSIVLGAEDAKDWIYKGEGAANLVLSYCGSSPLLVGKVLRIQKIAKVLKEYPARRFPVLSSHEKLVWRDVDELVQSPTREIACKVFVTHVLSNLLGSKHVDVGTSIRVTKEFLEAVQKKVDSERPSWRIDTSKIDTLCGTALLISDHSVFNVAPRQDFSIAVEIKPKCGFLPTSEFICKENSIKKCTTRFKMHQFLKLQKGEILEVSQYDPLDLFSGSKDRIKNAILAFLETPQNNFRVFLNGALVFGGLGGSSDNTPVHFQDLEALEDVIKATGLNLTNLVDLISETIYKSSILDRLLATQKLDTLDIEGAVHAYCNFTSQPCMVCNNIKDEELLRHYSKLHSLPLEKSLEILRNFLIAATAKDCSLMISFSPEKPGLRSFDDHSIRLDSSKHNFSYKAFFIDLDLKPLEKMVHYYELDQKIVACYKQCQETKEGSSNHKMKAQSN